MVPPAVGVIPITRAIGSKKCGLGQAHHKSPMSTRKFDDLYHLKRSGHIHPTTLVNCGLTTKECAVQINSIKKLIYSTEDAVHAKHWRLKEKPPAPPNFKEHLSS